MTKFPRSRHMSRLFTFPQTQKVLKDFHQALLCLKQIFIPEDHGVNLVRLAIVSTVILGFCFCLPSSILIYILKYMVIRQDLTSQPRYLVTFTVGIAQKANVDAAVKKFSDNFTIMLFHYDGHTTEWDEFEWSKRAIHVSVRKQTKWWYAKRFLHPDVVSRYEYIFIWDEDLGVEHFNAEAYIEIVRKHGLEISQPGLESDKKIAWRMTKRHSDQEVHK
ncbi:hypothetical protein SEVIR_7G052500v4 [Setaria viridis]